MSLEAIKPINVDFHDSKYILINAKQYDRKSRFVLVSCYNNGVVFPLNKFSHYAYIRYRKADNLGVFNSCEITDGKILVKLSEQMLATVGKCYADLVIVENKPIEVDENTGELIFDNDCKILSSMIFCINVVENAFDNTEIESSYEYNALNDLLIKATEDYTSVVKACKVSEDNAKLYATTSSNYTQLSKSYAVGGTGTRTDENIDNSKYYYSQTKAISDNLGGVFAPQGTIKFAELPSVTKATGYVYHVEDAFVTDNTFKCGAGITYPAGTNVYCTSDGYWDCFISQIVDDNSLGKLNQMIIELQERVRLLEERTVLEITE